MSKFHNLSDAALADEYGNIKAQIAPLEDRLEEVKEELKLRADGVPIVGHRWTVDVNESTQSRLDTKALRALLGDDLKPYEKTSRQTRVTVKPTMILGQAAE